MTYLFIFVDWIHDHIKEGLRLRRLRETPGLRGRWMKAKDASQAWILVILTGATVAVIAGLIDVVQEWMSDLKGEYCTTNWRYNSKFCCWGKQGDHAGKGSHGYACYSLYLWLSFHYRV